MNYRSLLVSLAMGATLGATNSAQAGSEVGSWYLAPKAVYFNPDRLQRAVDADNTTRYKVSNAIGGSIGFGKVLNDNWDADISYVYSSHKAGAMDTSYKSIEVVATRVFMRENQINPFVGVGLNNTHYSLTTVNSRAQSPIESGTGYLLKIGAITN